MKCQVLFSVKINRRSSATKIDALRDNGSLIYIPDTDIGLCHICVYPKY